MQKNQLKKDLSFAHKIIAHLKMDDLTYTHLSIREYIEKPNYNFYLSPFGICFEQVQSNDLLEINQFGQIISQGNPTYNLTGVTIHNAIYSQRPDICAIIHLHTTDSIIVSTLKHGLLPISQHALHFYEHISYHSYDSLILDEKQQAIKVANDLGNINKIILLRNHGFITCGHNIQEALFYAYHLERACQVQARIANIDSQNLIIPSEEICRKAFNELNNFEQPSLGMRDWQAWIKKLN